MSNDAAVLRNEGQLDPAFGSAGRVVLQAPGAPGQSVLPQGIGVDAAGRVYVGGALRIGENRFAYYCVRLTAQGTVDPAFGEAGYVIGEFAPHNGRISYSGVSEVIELSNGKILLIGNYYDDTFNTWKGLIRLHPDGTPDPAFGEDGTLLIALGSISGTDDDSVDGLNVSSTPRTAGSNLLPDGKILLHESVYDGLEETQTAIIRLTADGVLDPDFNQTGIVWVAHPDFAHTEITDILLADDGKYVLAGHCDEPGDPPARAIFTRLHASGITDTSFASNGYLLIESARGDTNYLLDRLVAQTNKRLLGIGYGLGQEDCGLLISREADGGENIQFNRGNPLLLKLDGRITSWHDAIIQQDGSILVYGHLYDPARTVVAKFTDAGTLDKTFGGGTGWLQYSVDPFGLTSAIITDASVLFFGATVVDGQAMPCIARGLIAPPR
ncbi:hypothetical protein [Pseudomonas sp. A34-9]|uniref:hypothetical protein n=1 Tax=Pseudomonas sp. A34-9 TaxID=3034675 RepID=UPI00240DF45D|nr:hypothetical protein [Pseudomonas sp. A34-9]